MSYPNVFVSFSFLCLQEYPLVVLLFGPAVPANVTLGFTRLLPTPTCNELTTHPGVRCLHSEKVPKRDSVGLENGRMDFLLKLVSINDDTPFIMGSCWNCGIFQVSCFTCGFWFSTEKCEENQTNPTAWPNNITSVYSN